MMISGVKVCVLHRKKQEKYTISLKPNTTLYAAAQIICVNSDRKPSLELEGSKSEIINQSAVRNNRIFYITETNAQTIKNGQYY